MKDVLYSLLIAVAVNGAGAQSAPARFEVVGGVNFSNVSGAKGYETKTRTGLFAGVGMIKPFASGLSFQPEAAYSMEGMTEENATTSIAVKLAYIEIPLLVRYDWQRASAVRPFFLAGPAVGINLRCDGEIETGAGKVDKSCKDAGIDMKTLDPGLMFGGGLAIRHLNHTFGVGVRYNLGLTDIAKDQPNKNRVLSVVGTFEWPLHM